MAQLLEPCSRYRDRSWSGTCYSRNEKLGMTKPNAKVLLLLEQTGKVQPQQRLRLY